MTVHSAGKLDSAIHKRRENRMRLGQELSAQRAAQRQAGMVAPPAPAYNYNYPDSPNYQPSLVNWTHGSQPYQGRTTTIRRGTVENMIQASPFKHNPDYVAGMRNDAINKRYEDRMRLGEELSAKKKAEQEAARAAAVPALAPNPAPAPDYQRSARRTKSLSSLRTMSM